MPIYLECVHSFTNVFVSEPLVKPTMDSSDTSQDDMEVVADTQGDYVELDSSDNQEDERGGEIDEDPEVANNNALVAPKSKPENEGQIWLEAGTKILENEKIPQESIYRWIYCTDYDQRSIYRWID